MALYDSILDHARSSLAPDILFKISLFFTQQGELERAESLLREIVASQPAGKYYFNFAWVLFKNGKVGEALENMKIARERYASQLPPEQSALAGKAVTAWRDGQ